MQGGQSEAIRGNQRQPAHLLLAIRLEEQIERDLEGKLLEWMLLTGPAGDREGRIKAVEDHLEGRRLGDDGMPRGGRTCGEEGAPW